MTHDQRMTRAQRMTRDHGTMPQHGGNLKELAERANLPEESIIDFSANINPFGPPGWLRSEISSTVTRLQHYPDPECRELVRAIAQAHDISAETVIAGNGSSELFSCLDRVLEASRAVIPVPAYSEYARTAACEIRELPLDERAGFRLDPGQLESELAGGEVVYLGRPNNPTGIVVEGDALRAFARAHPAVTFVVDEAFADFVPGCDTLIDDRPPNVIVIRSMTKFYCIPGLRLGYAVAQAPLIAKLRAVMPRWSVNAPAQAVGVRALSDTEYAEKSRAFVAANREALAGRLSETGGITVYPGAANFLLLRVDKHGYDAYRVSERLLERGIAVRSCEGFGGLDRRYMRVAVRTGRENTRLCEALESLLHRRPARSVRKRRPAVMLQGTGSSAGKSVLASALCRILLQDGYRVAPFKAQNMSLNSFVTAGGGEIGRAQAVQAQACRVEPDVRMNPVLLKPASDTGSQIIVLGKPVGDMNVAEYGRYTRTAMERVHEAFDSLAAEYDVVVIEGAGSPAEVNLKDRDIANMHMAGHAGAPVLLAGDIDRGGVFASFVGTMELLSEHEREMVAGFVVNRFRGDAALLIPAFEHVLRHTGRPVLGTVPYIEGLYLPHEDSVELKSGACYDSPASPGGVHVGIIDLPHISNSTDFDALRLEPDVGVRMVRSPDDLVGDIDAVIIPGSKSVAKDLAYLRRTGIAAALSRRAAAGTVEVVGICGGYQMLGRAIADPHGVESHEGTVQALGLLPVTTVLSPGKTLERVEAVHVPSGLAVFGYEIHHGRTQSFGTEPVIRRADGETIGVAADGLRVWGTYMHGVFDADPFRRRFVNELRARRGLQPLEGPGTRYDLEPAFDRLAGIVRGSLDIPAVYRMMGLR